MQYELMQHDLGPIDESYVRDPCMHGVGLTGRSEPFDRATCKHLLVSSTYTLIYDIYALVFFKA
jgi:hypothetical protein